MANFEGYLLKATATGEIFPNKYILYESWESTPKVREEIEAWRDDNTRDLYRVTAEGTKSSFKFTIKQGRHLADVEKILAFFTSGESDSLQRKINLTYWNDETLSYETADFYRPDITYTIRKITKNDIIYNEFDIECIEY